MHLPIRCALLTHFYVSILSARYLSKGSTGAIPDQTSYITILSGHIYNDQLHTVYILEAKL